MIMTRNLRLKAAAVALHLVLVGIASAQISVVPTGTPPIQTPRPSQSGPVVGVNPIGVLLAGKAIRIIRGADKKPLMKQSLDGWSIFFYRNDVLISERAVARGGRYRYDSNGRFERLDYSDGTYVKAVYGAHGELAALRSCTGGLVKFSYPSDRRGLLPVQVSPTSSRAKEFHTALAILVAQRNPTTGLQQFSAEEGDGEGKKEDCGESSCEIKNDGGQGPGGTDGGYPGPEYPDDPFPGVPREPDPSGKPIPTIEIPGQREDEEEPFSDPVFRNDGSHEPSGASPTGRGSGRGRGGAARADGANRSREIIDDVNNGIPYESKEACDAACDNATNSFIYACNVLTLTNAKKPHCYAEVNRWSSECRLGCSRGDFTWQWINNINFNFWPNGF